MSKTLKFYGASDDLFECDGDVQEEISSTKGTMFFAVIAKDGGLLVSAKYLTNGCWSIGVAQTQEYAPLPAWPMRIELAPINGTNDGPYSTMLVIEAPDDVIVRKAKP